MAKYQVIRAWHGVSVGQVIELDDLHPSLKANVIAVSDITAKSNEAGDLLESAKAEIAKMREQAEAEAKSIIDSANEEAERIKADALKKVDELTPSTPEAATKPTKAK